MRLWLRRTSLSCSGFQQRHKNLKWHRRDVWTRSTLENEVGRADVMFIPSLMSLVFFVRDTCVESVESAFRLPFTAANRKVNLLHVQILQMLHLCLPPKFTYGEFGLRYFGIFEKVYFLPHVLNMLQRGCWNIYRDFNKACRQFEWSFAKREHVFLAAAISFSTNY